MEAQQQQQPVNNHEDGGVGNNMKNTPPPSFLCRQSSTRWTPTTDQIRILKDLYYNNGVRSPSADQIQRISARLRQYGKIEGKNVFYWFQNHKARERQKKRFTTTTDHHIPPPSFQRNNNNAIKPAHWRSSEDHPNIHNNINNNNYPPNMINPPGVVQSPPPPGVFAAVGQMGSNCGYGSAAMEMSFRECSISPKDHINCGSIGQAPSYSSIPCPYPFLDKIKSIGHDDGQEDQQEEDDDVACGEIETLPLFPMHGEEEYYSCHGYNIKPAESSRGHNYYNGWYQSDDVNSFGGSSLELSLNSYITGNRSTDHFY